MSDEAINRRLFLFPIGATGICSSLRASPRPDFIMWHSPGCGCCLEWAKRIEASFGRALTTVEAGDIADVKRARAVPAKLQSCHTALLQGYVIEGHVPAEDIRRLIASKSRIIRGLSVPGMPAGSPGMDGGGHKQSYKVFSFGAGGRQAVFASHN